MDTKGKIRKLNMYDAHNKADADYIDGNIALYMNIKDIPARDGAIRLDMYVILACINGRMRVDIGGIPYSIAAKDVIICLPNRTVNECLFSPDFEGIALCVSQKALQQYINGNVMWERGLELLNRPLVHISEESANELMAYSHALDTAIRSSRKQFRKQIIMSLVSVCLYELMSNIEIPEPESAARLTQKDYLFRSFIELLTGLDVKPRDVKWYADKLNVTPKYLSTACKEVSGQTAFRWISDAVEKDIVSWLQNSDLSIKEIVSILQFPNNSFFGKYCRQHLGMSPTQLREKFRSASKS